MQPGLSELEPQENVEQWLQIGEKIEDPHAALEYAQHAADLRPDDPRVQESVRRSVLQKLDHDPHVTFLAETDKTYIVTFRDSRPVAVPKAREQPEEFPPPVRTEGERALGMIWWMALGLLLAGTGALILSPFVMRRGLNALSRNGSDRREIRLAWLAIALASGVGALGAFFTSLLILHLVA